ncbi:MAG: hypothetical protein PUE81_03940 [Lachnospiraceae bacterium]|nr:hypothetical protein [Lachnospiraceae bacterium]
MRTKTRKSKLLALGLAFAMTVSSIVVVPGMQTEAASKSKTVTSQAQLNAALKDGKISKITIKTSKKTNFTIKKGSYSRKTLVINADKATVTNAGKFKGISITKAATVNEKADANAITVTDTKLTLNIKKGADKSAIILGKKNADIKLVADGKVSSVTVAKDAKLSISGKSQVGKLTVNADNTNLTVGKSITINNISVDDATVSASTLKGSSLLGANVIMYTKKIEIVNHGYVKAIVLAKAATVNVSGNSKTATDIVNNAQGSSISTSCPASLTLNEGAAVEVAKGGSLDKLTINSDSADVKVAEGAKVENVEITKEGSNVGLDVDGAIANIDVKVKSDVNISGATETAIAIKSEVEGASVATKVPVEVSASAAVKVTLEAGAEGSKITATTENVKVDVSNNSTEKVEVTTPSGSQEVESGQSGSVSDSTTNGNQSGGGETGGSTGGGYVPSVPSEPVYSITYKISQQATNTGINAVPNDLQLPTSFKKGDSLTIPVPTGDETYKYVWAYNGYVINESGWTLDDMGSVSYAEEDVTLELYAVRRDGTTSFTIKYNTDAIKKIKPEYAGYKLPDGSDAPTSYTYNETRNWIALPAPNNYDNYYVTWECDKFEVYNAIARIPTYYVGDVTLTATVKAADTVTCTVTGTNASPDGSFVNAADGSYFKRMISGEGRDSIWLWADDGYEFVCDSEGNYSGIQVTDDQNNAINVSIVPVETDVNGRSTGIRLDGVLTDKNVKISVTANEIKYNITYEISEQAREATPGVSIENLSLPAAYVSGDRLTISVPAATEAYTYVWSVDGYVIDESGEVQDDDRENITNFETNLTLVLYAIPQSGDLTFKITYDMSEVENLVGYVSPDYPTTYTYGTGFYQTEEHDQIRTPNDFAGYYVTWEWDGVDRGSHVCIPDCYVGDVHLKAKLIATDTVTYTVKGANLSLSGDFAPQEDGSYKYKIRVDEGNTTQSIYVGVAENCTFTETSSMIIVKDSEGNKVGVDIEVQLDKQDSSGRIEQMIIYVPVSAGNLTFEIGNVAEVPTNSTGSSNTEDSSDSGNSDAGSVGQN